MVRSFFAYQYEKIVEKKKLKIGILVVAYNAATTLASVLDRIPSEFKPEIDEVIVSDDFSQDSTYLVGLGYQQESDLPLTLIRQPKNLGYGGNQKAGYKLAIEHDLDIVVLLHGDGQYAPECLPSMVAPIVDGQADAVFGSRMMVKGNARKGGMPLYKYVGNKILSKFENGVLGTSLTEFHSGYRAYRVDSLKKVRFQDNTNDFNFDTQIIIQFFDAGMRIKEIPIPTYYGDEICYVDGIGYAAAVTKDVLAYRLQKAGFGMSSRVSVGEEYELKESPDTSHGRILSILASRAKGRVLDIGCSSGLLGEKLSDFGHSVVGVDSVEIDGVRERLGNFVLADLNQGIPSAVGKNYDYVVAADVLEHLNKPDNILSDIHRVLDENGSLFVSVPNFSHWYPRFRVLFGAFGYDRRGILDEGHIRFFTRRSIRRMLEGSKFEISNSEVTGLPIEVFGIDGAIGKFGRLVESVLLSFWPTMFG